MFCLHAYVLNPMYARYSEKSKEGIGSSRTGVVMSHHVCAGSNKCSYSLSHFSAFPPPPSIVRVDGTDFRSSKTRTEFWFCHSLACDGISHLACLRFSLLISIKEVAIFFLSELPYGE